MKSIGMNRRDFLKKSVEWAACTAAAVALPGRSTGAETEEKAPDLVVADGSPGPATRAAVEAMGGIARYVRPKDKVVIKPNMSFPNPPEWGTTTHPDVVRELTSLCLKAGASSVLVLDNPLRNSEMCLERSGLRRACGDLPETQVQGLTDRSFFEAVKIPEGKALTSTMVMKKALEADVLIAVPVAKSHSATGVSLSIKGMMGLVYDRRTFHMDLDLDVAVVDLCTVLKPTLTIIDASRILSEGGPGGPGKVIPMNKIIASKDFVAADAAAVELGTWYGRKFKGRQVKHIQMAHARGLGRIDVSSLSVKEVHA
jgi:uncharacterized protein (DUF362 family)